MSVLSDLTEASGHVAVLDRPNPTRLRSGVPNWQAGYRKSVIVTDLLASVVVSAAAYSVRFGGTGDLVLGYLAFAPLFPLIWIALLRISRAHETRFLFAAKAEVRKILSAGGVLMIGIAVVSYAGKLEVARGWVLLSVPSVTAATIALRAAHRRRLHRRREAGECMHRTVLVGYERAAASFFRTLQVTSRHGLHFVAACLPDGPTPGRPATLDDCGLPVAGGFDDVPAVVEEYGADLVVVLPCPEMDGTAIRRLGWDLERSRTELLVAPALLQVAGPRVMVRPMADLPLLHVEHAEQARRLTPFLTRRRAARSTVHQRALAKRM